jgi:hypothetical protein
MAFTENLYPRPREEAMTTIPLDDADDSKRSAASHHY